MQGGFRKFRKKQKFITLINSLVWGIATALFALGLVLFLSKLNIISLHLLFYILIPSVGFVLAAGVCYLCSRKKDGAIAKRIDERYALNDRAQTMVEFQDKQTDMVRLQREDTQARLETLPLSKYRWKGFWGCLIALVLAAAMFVTGFIFPDPKTATDEEPQPPPLPGIEFNITDEQKTKLGTLIKNVEGSKAENKVKVEILSKLTALQAGLDEIETADELYDKLIQIILHIDGYVETHNTYKRVYKTIRASQIETVQRFAIGIGSNDLTAAFSIIMQAFNNDGESSEEALASINEFVVELEMRFDEVNEGDKGPLTEIIAKVIDEVTEVAKLPSTKAYHVIIDGADKALNGNVKILAEVLTQQAENRSVTSATINSLITIFNIPQELIPEWGGEPLEGLDLSEEVPEEPTKPGEGILIDGMQYPSNEKVYDYFTKVICEYGKVFEGEAYNYKAAINQLLADGVVNGTLDPKVEEMIRNYLDEISGKDPIVGGENQNG